MSLNCFDGGLEISIYDPPISNHQQVLEEIRNRPARRPSTDYWDYVMLNRMVDHQNLNRQNVRTSSTNNMGCFSMIFRLVSFFS